MTGYPLGDLYEEIAFLAYHFHWDYETIMNMEHIERKLWCEEISKINKKLNGDETKNLTDIQEDNDNHRAKERSLLCI